MIKLLLRFGVLVVLAFAFTWMANQPGTMSVTWLGYQIDEIPVYLVMLGFFILFFVVWFTWWVIRLVFCTPGAVGGFFRSRRHRKGIDALSRGMVAVSAGDAVTARKQALQAKKLVADSPLAHLLEAQAAQLRGDDSRVSQIYKEMLDDPETEVVALRGLYVAARKQGDDAAARDYAERANRRDGSLAWASTAMSGYLSNDNDWPAVAGLIDRQRRAGVLNRDEANAKQAVVLTAQAMGVEHDDPAAAIDLATKAHKLNPALVPAAVVAGRVQAAQGSLRKAARILEKTWRLSPHPEIAETYVHARAGDSAQDRLRRVKDLLRVSDGGAEGAVALANVAIDARDWTAARKALEPHVSERPPVRLCMLMAEIEEGEFGNTGKAREWLSRAVRAPRDPAWAADGYVSDSWLPMSPVSGELGAFAWKVPVTALGRPPEEEVIDELESDAILPGDDAIVVGSEADDEGSGGEASEIDEPVEVVGEPEPEADEAELAAQDEPSPSEALEAEDQDEPVEAVAEAESGDEPPAEPAEPSADRSGSRAPEVAEDATEEAVAEDAEAEAEPEAAEQAASVESEAEETADASEELLPDNRQPDDPGPRTDRPVNGRRSWFG